MQQEWKRICEMAVGDETSGTFILKTAQIKTSANGSPFLKAELMDRTGSIDTKMWDYTGQITPDNAGSAVIVAGNVSEFRGNRQLILSSIHLAQPEDHVDISELVPTAPIDAEGAFQKVLELVVSIADPDYRQICEAMLERHRDEFRRIPAAKSVHHAFLNGLLMHTSNMLDIADFLAGLYPECIDRSLLLAGTLLHDFGKAREFAFSELGMVTEYSTAGILLEHLVMGAQEVAAAAVELGLPEKKSMLLQHMLLSHHGQPEFGAAVQPCCAESQLLHLIDLIDSRMETYRENLAELHPGEFKKVFSLDGQIYRHA